MIIQSNVFYSTGHQEAIEHTYHSPNIYKETGKLSIHYAAFPASLPHSCRVHKEQNDQIQESDAGASVRVSGQNRLCAAVCSMSTILLPGHWCHLAGNGETFHSSLQSH